MLYSGEAVRKWMEGDSERWLYCLAELDDPILSLGVFPYLPGGREKLSSRLCPLDATCVPLAWVSDMEEGCVVRLFSDSRRLLEEAVNNPAVRSGTRFCFSGGLPEGIRADEAFFAGGRRLIPQKDRRTLEKYGLYGSVTTDVYLSSETDGEFHIYEAKSCDKARCETLDEVVWGRFPALCRAHAEEAGDLLLLASRRGEDEPLGYLWAARTNRGFMEIVNLFVRSDARRQGIGQALTVRFVEEAKRRGQKPYYGYAASMESARLAHTLGFRKIYGETFSFLAE